MMEVTLVPVGRRNVDRGERTFTDNISAHGIRVKSANVWRMGEQAEVTPTKGEVSLRGEVVYCQKVGDARFFVGLKFPSGHVPWSILKRFNGLALTGILAAMRW
jgi:hypothetical protein